MNMGTPLLSWTLATVCGPMSAVAWQLQASLGGSVTRPPYRGASCSAAPAACATVPSTALPTVRGAGRAGEAACEAATVVDVVNPNATNAYTAATSAPAADPAPASAAANTATPEDAASPTVPIEGSGAKSAAVAASEPATDDPLLLSSGIEANFSSIGDELQHRLQPHLAELSDAVDSMLNLRSGGCSDPRRLAAAAAASASSGEKTAADPRSVASSMDEMQLTLIRCGRVWWQWEGGRV